MRAVGLVDVDGEGHVVKLGVADGDIRNQACRRVFSGQFTLHIWLIGTGNIPLPPPPLSGGCPIVVPDQDLK